MRTRRGRRAILTWTRCGLPAGGREGACPAPSPRCSPAAGLRRGCRQHGRGRQVPQVEGVRLLPPRWRRALGTGRDGSPGQQCRGGRLRRGGPGGRGRGMRRGKATTRRRPEGEPPTPGPRRAGQRRGVMCTKTPASVHRREEGTCRRVSCVSGAASVAYGPTNMLWAARRRTTADKRTQDAGPLEHGRRGRWGPRSGGIVSDRHSLTRWILPRVSAEKSSDRCPRAGGGV